ncbi:MAG: YlbF family regulator [Lachnospiraceae bacterium]|nr:YlbF family regulator [Lachnospiraceae bacterium]
MSLIEEKAKELAEIISNSAEYQNYLRVKQEVEHSETLCHKINDYRSRNFQLRATLEGEELYNAMENFEREYASFRKDPLVNQFLAAELRMVRIIQQVEKIIVDTVDLDLNHVSSHNQGEA